MQFEIKGMNCDHCARTIEKTLDADGIIEKNVSYREAGALISFDPTKISGDAIKQMIDGTGHYKVSGSSEIAESGSNDQHLIIIGGGSAAFAAAIEASARRAKVTMINDGLPIGGTCVNVGCVPSKNLIRAAEALHKTNHNPFAGMQSQGKLISFKELIRQKRDLVFELQEQKYINVIKDMDQFRLIEGRAKLLSSNSVEVNGETIRGSHVLLATGARPFIPDIPGLKDVPYLTNESAFELEQLPESVIVLGGRYIALEIAQMFARLGSKVTLLQRSQRILPSETADLTDALSGYLRDEGINIETGNYFQRVNQNNGQIVVQSMINNEKRTFSAEKIIVAAGRQANTDNMGLAEVGVALNANGFVKTDKYQQTSVSGIYAAGDVLGENMFVYTAAYEGNLAASNMFNPVKKEKDYMALPWVVFTDPQVAGVGLDEKQANEKKIDYDVSVVHMNDVPRALAAHNTRGFIKLLRNKANDQLIGARMVASEGSEMLMEIALAIRYRIPVKELKQMFHPYLTLSEAVKIALIAFDKDVKKLSCCAV